MPLSAIAARRLAAQKKALQNKSSEVLPESIVSSDSDLVQLKQEAHRNADRPEDGIPASKKRKRRIPDPAVAKEALMTGEGRKTPGKNSRGSQNVIQPEQEVIVTRPSILSKAAVTEPMDMDAASASDVSSGAPDYDSEASGSVEAIPSTSDAVAGIISSRLTTVKKNAVTIDERNGLNSSLIRILPGQEVVCVGHFDLCVRRGSVSLLGAVIHASSKVHRIYAPSSHALPVIRGLQHPKAEAVSGSEILLSSCDSGIQQLEKLNPKLGRIWNQSSGSYQVLWDVSDDSLRRPLAAFKDPVHWQVAAGQILSAGVDRIPRIAVCGLKGSGKSTFARFLSNALISSSSYNSLAFLDVDPGQPEFSMCEEISLSLVSGFNFGPSYTHPGVEDASNVRLWTHYYGSKTPRDDPVHYLNCVSDLIGRYKRDYNQYPLIINFSGWTLGEGLHTLDRILSAASPTNIVMMNSTGDGDLVEFMQPRSTDPTVVCTNVTSVTIQASSRSSADLRTMHTLSHFHVEQAAGKPLGWNSVPVTEMPCREWIYDGDHRCIDGILSYNEEINTEMLDVLIRNSLVCVLRVDGDDDLETAISSDNNDHDASMDDSAQNYWQDSRLGDGFDINLQPEDDQVGRTGEPRPMMSRVSHGLPFYLPRQGEYCALDPARSRVLGQAYVKVIDFERRSLHVVTHLTTEALQDHRASGARILLVRGRSDMPTWALLEPYYEGLARNAGLRRREIQNRAQGKQGNAEMEEIEEEGQFSFDAAQWAEGTPHVQVIDRSDVELRRRMKPWRTRRNLETSGARTKA